VPSNRNDATDTWIGHFAGQADSGIESLSFCLIASIPIGIAGAIADTNGASLDLSIISFGFSVKRDGFIHHFD
jgi:hypothetical protein